jgi:hypothetical protein
LGVVTLPDIVAVPHPDTPQPRTAAPTGAAIQLGDLDGLSTGTGSHPDPTAATVERRAYPALRESVDGAAQ